MSDMSDDELKRIVELVVKELKKNNPSEFVTQDFCRQRYDLCSQRFEWIAKAVRGLYVWMGAVGVAIIGALAAIILAKLGS